MLPDAIVKQVTTCVPNLEERKILLDFLEADAGGSIIFRGGHGKSTLTAMIKKLLPEQNWRVLVLEEAEPFDIIRGTPAKAGWEKHHVLLPNPEEIGDCLPSIPEELVKPVKFIYHTCSLKDSLVFRAGPIITFRYFTPEEIMVWTISQMMA